MSVPDISYTPVEADRSSLEAVGDDLRADGRETDDAADRSSPDVAALARGDRLEHDDGQVWHVVGTSARSVTVRMPDGQRLWVDHDSLRHQLVGEPIHVVRND